jgi:hypothetical protein
VLDSPAEEILFAASWVDEAQELISRNRKTLQGVY